MVLRTVGNDRLIDGEKLDQLPGDLTGEAGKILKVNPTEDGYIFSDEPIGDDEKVRVSNTDTTPGFLIDKLLSAGDLQYTTVDPGANEKLQIQLNGDYVKKSGTGTIENITNPTNAQDVATKDYVDNITITVDKEDITGLKIADSPEFADVLITNLSTDSWLSNTAKSVLSFITLGWQYVKELLGFQQVNGLPVSSEGIKFTRSYDYSTRTLTLVHISNWYYYVGGKRFTVTGNVVFPQHDTTNGLKFFYFDITGTAQTSNTAWDLLNTSQIQYTFYNSSNADTVKHFTANECHGMNMSSMTHYYSHFTRGTQYISGGALTGYTLQTDSVTAVTYAVNAASLLDEDRSITTNAVSDGGPYTILWRSGSNGDWNWTTIATIPYLISGGSRIEYNQFTGGVWQRTALTTGVNEYVNYYVVYTGLDTYSTLVIPGQTTYATLAEAQAETIGNLSLGNLPFVEFAFLYKVTMRRNNTYSATTGNARIEAVAQININTSTILGTASNHNSLSNLQLAGSTITWGHINDIAQTIAGLKTLTDGLISGFIQALSSAGFNIKNTSGGDVAIFGAGGGTGTTFKGGIIGEGTLSIGSYIEIAEQANPSTPGTGKYQIYAKSDNTFYGINDAGNIYAFQYKTLKIIAIEKATDWAVATNIIGDIPLDGTGQILWVRATCSTAGTTGVGTIDINIGANSILSTKLTLDSGEKTSKTAATAFVLDTNYTTFSDDAILTIDIDGTSTTKQKGLVVEIGYLQFTQVTSGQ